MDCCDLTAANEESVWNSSADAGPPAVSNHSSDTNLENQPYMPLQHQWDAEAAEPLVNQQQQPAAGQFPPYRPVSSASQWQSQPAPYHHQQHQHQQQQQHQHQQQPQQYGAPAPPAGNWQQQLPQQQWRQESPSSYLYYSSISTGNGYGRGMRTGNPGGRYGNNSGSNSFGNNSTGQGQSFRSGGPGYNGGGGRSSWGGIQHGSPGRGYNSYNTNYNNARGPSPRPLAGSSGGPPCWVKQDCWLLPRQGATTAAAATAAAAAGSALPGTAAAKVVASSSVGGSNRVVHIMRGLPGAGKSTRAAQLAEAAEQAAVAAALDSAGGGAASSSATVVAIHSTDNYFIDAAGVYRFNAALLGLNHQRNYDAFCASLAAGVSTVILDNTNLQPWQFEQYVTAAWQRGYSVREEVVGEFTEAAAAVYAARNTHGVPHDKILGMLDQWRRQ